MACIGNSTDTSHFNIVFKVNINFLCFFLAVFSDSEYLDTPSSEENGFFILLRTSLNFLKNFYFKSEAYGHYQAPCPKPF